MEECLYTIVVEINELLDSPREFNPQRVIDNLNEVYNHDHYDVGGWYESLTEKEEEELTLKGRVALNELEELECFIESLWKLNNFISHDELEDKLEELQNLKNLENIYPLMEETKDLVASIQIEFNKLVNEIL